MKKHTKLTKKELSSIKGGGPRDYDFGYTIGTGVKNFGKFIWYGLTGEPHYVS